LTTTRKDFLLIGAQEPMASRLADNSNVFKGIPPYFTPYGRDFMRISPKAYNFPAYALPILAACLKRKGFSVSCMNDFYSEPPEKVEKALKNTKYAVGISTTFLTNARSIAQIAKYVRRVNPALKIIMGGPGIINSPEARKQSDVNILYEGERTIEELAPPICCNKSLSKIDGISYFKGRKEVLTKRREPISDLGDIPVPYWKALSGKVKEERYLPIESSRGCIGNCSFCLETRYWPGVRFYPIERVIREIKEGVLKCGVRFYYFQDSNISNSPKYLSDLCDAIHKAKLKITWSCESRIDTITKELVDKMSRAGCKGITFGMESADPGVLRNMNKYIPDKKMKSFSSVVKYMRKKKMLANINMIVGFPGDDKKSIDRTIKFLLEARPIAYSMSKFFLERGTDIWNNRKSFGMKGSMFNWEHDTMKSSELDALIRYVFLRVSKKRDIYHWASASVDLVRFMSKGKTFTGFVKYLKAVNRMCVEDLTRKKGAYSRKYNKNFRYISKFLV